MSIPRDLNQFLGRKPDQSVGCDQHDQCLQGPCQVELPNSPSRDPWHARVQRLRGDVALLRRSGVLVVVVTGSREWKDEETVRASLRRLLNKPGLQETYPPHRLLIIHGDARGLDRLAGQRAEALGMNVLSLPAPWGQWGKAAGVLRNQAMIDLKPDLVLGFPIGKSTGTRDCLRRAQQANIPTIVVEG